MNFDEEERIKNDKKYRAFHKDLHKVLASIEKTPQAEWAQLNSNLAQLQKVVLSHREVPDLPDKLYFFGALCKCMDPNVAMGVHKKAVETLAIVCGRLPAKVLCEYLPLFTLHVFSLLQNAANQIRPDILTLIERVVVPLPLGGLLPALPGLVGAVLPCTQEKDIANKAKRILDLLRERFDALQGVDPASPTADAATLGTAFHRTIWSIVRNVPSTRVAALTYQRTYFVRASSPTAATATGDGAIPATNDAVNGAEPSSSAGAPFYQSSFNPRHLGRDGMHVAALAAALRSKQDAQRQALDMLIYTFPLSDEGALSFSDKVLLVRAALEVLVTNQNTTLRRVFMWLYGGDTIDAHYFKTVSAQYVTQALSDMFLDVAEILQAGAATASTCSSTSTSTGATAGDQNNQLLMFAGEVPRSSAAFLQNQNQAMNGSSTASEAAVVAGAVQKTLVFEIFVALLSRPSAEEAFLKEIITPQVLPSLCRVLVARLPAHPTGFSTAGGGGAGGGDVGSTGAAGGADILGGGPACGRGAMSDDAGQAAMRLVQEAVPWTAFLAYCRETVAQLFLDGDGIDANTSDLHQRSGHGGSGGSRLLNSPDVIFGVLSSVKVILETTCEAYISTVAAVPEVAVQCVLETLALCRSLSRIIVALVRGGGDPEGGAGTVQSSSHGGRSSDSDKDGNGTAEDVVGHITAFDGTPSKIVAARGCFGGGSSVALALLPRVCLDVFHSAYFGVCRALMTAATSGAATTSTSSSTTHRHHEHADGSPAAASSSSTKESPAVAAAEAFAHATTALCQDLGEAFASVSDAYLQHTLSANAAEQGEDTYVGAAHQQWTSTYSRQGGAVPSTSSIATTAAGASGALVGAASCSSFSREMTSIEERLAYPTYLGPLHTAYVTLLSEVCDAVFAVYSQWRQEALPQLCGASHSDNHHTPGSTSIACAAVAAPVWVTKAVLLVQRGDPSVAVCCAQLLTDLIVFDEDIKRSEPYADQLRQEEERTNDDGNVYDTLDDYNDDRDVEDVKGSLGGRGLTACPSTGTDAVPSTPLLFPRGMSDAAVLKHVIVRLWPLFAATHSDHHVQLAKVFMRCYRLPKGRRIIDAVTTAPTPSAAASARYFCMLFRLIAEAKRNASGGAGGGLGMVLGSATADDTAEPLLLFPALKYMLGICTRTEDRRLTHSRCAGPRMLLAGFLEMSSGYMRRIIDPLLHRLLTVDTEIGGPRCVLTNAHRTPSERAADIANAAAWFGSGCGGGSGPETAGLRDSWAYNFRQKAVDWVGTLQEIMRASPRAFVHALMTSVAPAAARDVCGTVAIGSLSSENEGDCELDGDMDGNYRGSRGTGAGGEDFDTNDSGTCQRVYQLPPNEALAACGAPTDDAFPRTTAFGVTVYILLRIARAGQHATAPYVGNNFASPTSSSMGSPIATTGAAAAAAAITGGVTEDWDLLAAAGVPAIEEGPEDPLAVDALELLLDLLREAATVASTIDPSTATATGHYVPSLGQSFDANMVSGEAWVDASTGAVRFNHASAIASYIGASEAMLHLVALVANHLSHCTIELLPAAIAGRQPRTQLLYVALLTEALAVLDTMDEATLSDAAGNDTGLWGASDTTNGVVTTVATTSMRQGLSSARARGSGNVGAFGGAAPPSRGGSTLPAVDIAPVLHHNSLYRVLRAGLAAAALAELHPVLASFGLLYRWKTAASSLLPMMHTALPMATQQLFGTYVGIIDKVHAGRALSPLTAAVTARCIEGLTELIGFVFGTGPDAASSAAAGGGGPSRSELATSLIIMPSWLRGGGGGSARAAQAAAAATSRRQQQVATAIESAKQEVLATMEGALNVILEVSVSHARAIDRAAGKAHRDAQNALRVTRGALVAHVQQLMRLLIRHVPAEFFDRFVWLWMRRTATIATRTLPMPAPHLGGGSTAANASAASSGTSAASVFTHPPTGSVADLWGGGLYCAVVADTILPLYTPTQLLETAAHTLSRLRMGHIKAPARNPQQSLDMCYDAAVLHFILVCLLRLRAPERWTMQALLLETITAHTASSTCSLVAHIVAALCIDVAHKRHVSGGGPVDLLRDRRCSLVFQRALETTAPYVLIETDSRSPNTLALDTLFVSLADTAIASFARAFADTSAGQSNTEAKVIEGIAQVLTKTLIPTLKQPLEAKENDRVLALSSKASVVLAVITELFELGEGLQKKVRGDLLDIFFSDPFFRLSREAIGRWRGLLAVMTRDRTMNAVVLQRMSGNALAKTTSVFTSIVTSADDEAHTRAKLLRRLAFYIFATSSLDPLFVTHVRERVADTLRHCKGGKFVAVRAALFTFRVLMTRIPAPLLGSFWPAVLPEMLRVLGTFRMASDIDVAMEVLKTVDFAVTMMPAEFQVLRWAFLDDERALSDEYVVRVMRGKAEVSRSLDGHAFVPLVRSLCGSVVPAEVIMTHLRREAPPAALVSELLALGNSGSSSSSGGGQHHADAHGGPGLGVRPQPRRSAHDMQQCQLAAQTFVNPYRALRRPLLAYPEHCYADLNGVEAVSEGLTVLANAPADGDATTVPRSFASGDSHHNKMSSISTSSRGAGGGAGSPLAVVTHAELFARVQEQISEASYASVAFRAPTSDVCDMVYLHWLLDAEFAHVSVAMAEHGAFYRAQQSAMLVLQHGQHGQYPASTTTVPMSVLPASSSLAGRGPTATGHQSMTGGSLPGTLRPVSPTPASFGSGSGAAAHRTSSRGGATGTGGLTPTRSPDASSLQLPPAAAGGHNNYFHTATTLSSSRAGTSEHTASGPSSLTAFAEDTLAGGGGGSRGVGGNGTQSSGSRVPPLLASTQEEEEEEADGRDPTDAPAADEEDIDRFINSDDRDKRIAESEDEDDVTVA